MTSDDKDGVPAVDPIPILLLSIYFSPFADMVRHFPQQFNAPSLSYTYRIPHMLNPVRTVPSWVAARRSGTINPVRAGPIVMELDFYDLL